MKLSAEIELNLKIPEILAKVEEAVRLGLRDTIVAIHGDAIKPPSPVKTGHNRRSIASEVSGMGVVKQGTDAEIEKVVDDSKLEAAVYSTSGYGGFLETGTYKMPARPYFRPSLDKNKDKLIPAIKKHLESEK